MKIKLAKFIAMDTSQLGRMAKDFSSSDQVAKKTINDFLERIHGDGYLITVSFEHIAEMFSHADKNIIDERIRFFSSLELMGILRSVDCGQIVGSIIDIQAREVLEIFNGPSMSILQVREACAKSMFEITEGKTIPRFLQNNGRLIELALQRMSERRREIVAVAGSPILIGIGDKKISEILHLDNPKTHELNMRLLSLEHKLAGEISKSGDRRIRNHESVAKEFYNDVRAHIGSFDRSSSFIEQILKLYGLSPDDIGPETTISDVADIARFYRKLEIISRTVNIPFNDLKRSVDRYKMPSEMIQDEIDKHKPKTKEMKGSDLVDKYLACISPYTSMTFVDKRTAEALRRAQSKDPKFKSIVGNFEKAKYYPNVL